MKKALSLVIILGGLLLSMGCSNSYGPGPNRIQVATSFYPLYFFTSQIARENVEVINITPAGVEPHDFEPTAKDIARIENSKLLILNGFGFEPWGEKIKDRLKNKGTQVLEMEGTAFTPHDAEFNQHVWLDPELASREARIIGNALENLDPVHQEKYSKNTLELVQKLTDLDAEYRQGLAECRHKKFITSHDAFKNLALTYGLEQKSISGLSPEAEPSAKQLAELVEFAKNNNIHYIFFESLVSPKLAETLAKEVGAKTLILNPLEGLTEEDAKNGKDYFSIMRENLNNLRTALECN